MSGQKTGRCCQLCSLGEQRAEMGCGTLPCGGRSWARLPGVLHRESSMSTRTYFLLMVLPLQEPVPSSRPLFIYPVWDGLVKLACRI